MSAAKIAGDRFVLELGQDGYPPQLASVAQPPERLYGIGNPDALAPGLAVIGARKATPYGIGCARRFARVAAEKGVTIISGGALGCDGEAHEAALAARGVTVVVLGGGCDEPYPARHVGLFQRAVEAGGAVISENPWQMPPLPYMFRARNRIIAGLADAVLIVEAGLPSGTFSTADEALDAGREVLVVPGAITSVLSKGANRLLYQGAWPIVDDESFEEALFRTCGVLARPERHAPDADHGPIVAALLAEPLSADELLSLAVSEFGAQDAQVRLMQTLVEAEAAGIVARQPDGRWGPVVRWD